MHIEAWKTRFKGYLSGLVSRYSKNFKESSSNLGIKKGSVEGSLNGNRYVITFSQHPILTDYDQNVLIVITSTSEEDNKKIREDLESKLRLNLTFARAIKPKIREDEASEALDRILKP